MYFEMTSHPGGQLVVTCNGGEIAGLDRSFWSERATVMIGGRPWTFGKDGGARTAVCDVEPGRAFRAERSGVFSSTWQVALPSGAYELKVSFWGRTYRVSRNGVQIGESGQDGFWKLRPTLDVKHDLAPEEGVFLLWIAYLMRRRQQAAAASNSS